jgi:hypothetical protein
VWRAAPLCLACCAVPQARVELVRAAAQPFHRFSSLTNDLGPVMLSWPVNAAFAAGWMLGGRAQAWMNVWAWLQRQRTKNPSELGAPTERFGVCGRRRRRVMAARRGRCSCCCGSGVGAAASHAGARERADGMRPHD